MILTATGRSSVVSVARKTTPMPPRPSSRSSRYWWPRAAWTAAVRSLAVGLKSLRPRFSLKNEGQRHGPLRTYKTNKNGGGLQCRLVKEGFNPLPYFSAVTGSGGRVPFSPVRSQPTVAAVLLPAERPQVEAASTGCFTVLVRDSVPEALKAVRERPVDAVLLSVHRCPPAETDTIRQFLSAFPGLPTI